MSRFHYIFDIYLMDPGVTLWYRNTSHSLFWYRRDDGDGWNFSYIRYQRLSGA